jgi:hypothetical protein
MLYGCGLRVSEPLNIRIKDLNLETTMGYLHAESLSVRSPLDALLIKSTTTDQVLAQLPPASVCKPGAGARV